MASTELGKARNTDIMVGTIFGEFQYANFVVGVIPENWKKSRKADFMAGVALGESRGVDFHGRYSIE